MPQTSNSLANENNENNIQIFQNQNVFNDILTTHAAHSRPSHLVKLSLFFL